MRLPLGRLSLAMLTLTSALASVAQAQYRVNPTAPGQGRPQRLELSGFVGSLSLDQSLGSTSNVYFNVTGQAGNVDFGKFFGFRASWAFTPSIAAEFNMSRGSNAYTFDVDDPVIGATAIGEQFEADQLQLGGNLIIQFPLASGLVPYGTVGGGRLKTTPSSPIGDQTDVSSLDINFGGGIKYFLGRSWLGFRFDFRYHVISDHFAFEGNSESANHTEVTVGAVVRLF